MARLQLAKRATTTIPIVMAAAGDPMRAGIVANLAHPGGNITGVTAYGSELSGKRVEILKEALPAMARLAVLGNPTNPFNKYSYATSGESAGDKAAAVRGARTSRACRCLPRHAASRR